MRCPLLSRAEVLGGSGLGRVSGAGRRDSRRLRQFSDEFRSVRADGSSTSFPPSTSNLTWSARSRRPPPCTCATRWSEDERGHAAAADPAHDGVASPFRGPQRRRQGGAGAASRRCLRLAQIRCSWCLPIRTMSGPSSLKAPFGRTWPDHCIRVPEPAGSKVSVYLMSACCIVVAEASRCGLS